MTANDLQNKIQTCRSRIAQIRSQANHFQASQLCPDIYSEAVNDFANAETMHNADDLASALTLFESAYAKYEVSYYKSRQIILEKLVNDARSAQNNKQWNKVDILVSQIRLIDNDIAEEIIAAASKTKTTATTAALPPETVQLLPTLIDCNGVKLEMITVKSGTFSMGSRKASNGKKLNITLTKDFALGKFEVTQEQYEAVMRNNPSLYKAKKKPVENVNWYHAKAFCEKLNQLYKSKLPDGYIFDLPTEAQWEFAARGGVTNNVLYSKSAAWGSGTLRSIGWSSENILSSQDTTVNAGYDSAQTVAVGRLPPNGFGLYDMLGNVKEFCSDYSNDSTYSWPEGVAVNPTGVTEAEAAKTGQNIVKHILRGGDFSSGRTYITLRSRFSAGKYTRNLENGFRVICTVNQD